MYGLEEPKFLEALLGETTANKAELVDTLVFKFYIFIFVPCDGVREQYVHFIFQI